MHQLAGRQHSHAEHEVGENLVVPAHADIAAAELILEPPTDPLGPRAHDVATLLGKDETERPPRLLLTLQRLLHVDRAAGVHVDDRLVTKRDAVRPDLDGIIGRVHKVIEALDPLGRQGSQRNRHLGVMRRRRRHDAADGDPAIGRVDVQLVPDPGGGMALGVALGADIAGPRQVRQHLRKAHRQLPFQPARLLRPLLSLARPPPLARLRLRLLPRLDRRRIPRDVLHQMAIHRPSNQRLVQTARKTARGKLGKGPRKGRLARKPTGAAPAAQPAEPAVNLKTLDQRSRRRNVEQRLGDEGTRQRRTVLLRPPYLAAELLKKGLDTHQLQNRDEELVALSHRAELALKPREELWLKGAPIIR